MKVFINLPIKKLADSIAFWKAVGYAHNPQFTSETTTCIVLGEDNYVMLLEHNDFKRFTDKAIVDTNTHREVLVALSLDSKADVDAMMARVIANGGKAYGEPVDYGFMYQRAFIDIDGHHWEPFWMDPNHVM